MHLAYHRAVLVRALLGASLVGSGTSAFAADYQRVIAGSELNPNPATWTSTSGTFTVIDGTTAYAHFAKTNAPADFVINKTTGLGGVKSTSAITTLASWTANVSPYPAPTSSRIFGGFGTELVGSSIQIPDSSSSTVYRVDKNTGQVSVYLSNAALKAAAGGATATINALGAGVTPTGEAVIYENVTKQIVVTTGPGTASVLVDTATLAATLPGTGVTFDGSGNLYWGVSGSGLYRRDSGGTISQIMTPAQILSVLGGSATTWAGDVFYAPNGQIYFRYGGSGNQGILSFNPANPLGTLSVVLSNAQLLAGPAGSSAAGPMAWYNGNIGFTLVGSPSGFYAVPEPSALGLLGLASVFIARRRR